MTTLSAEPSAGFTPEVSASIQQLREDVARLHDELVVIDDDTTVRGFQSELPWDQAYFRLAQGL